MNEGGGVHLEERGGDEEVRGWWRSLEREGVKFKSQVVVYTRTLEQRRRNEDVEGW